MATASDTDIRAQLDELGERRAELDEQEKVLMKDVKRVLRRAYGRVSVTEAARRLRMHRTTVYRVYKPHG